MYKIYKYTNQINNKIYIGQTKNSVEVKLAMENILYLLINIKV